MPVEARGAGQVRRVGARRTRNARGQGERLRESLIEAAGELLLEGRPGEAPSIRAITGRAGVSPTAIYLHFSEKSELLDAVCDVAFEELRRFLLDAEESERVPRAQLKAMGLAYMLFALQRPGHYRILFELPPPPGQQLGELKAGDTGTAAFEDLVRATGRCLPPGVDPVPVALQIWTGLHGFVSLQTALPTFDWPAAEEFLERLASAHLD